MFLKAPEQNIRPLVENSQDAFLTLMNLLESRLEVQIDLYRSSFVEAMQTESLSGYFSVFSHLVVHYVYRESDPKYTVLLNAVGELPETQDEAMALITLRDAAAAQGGQMLEALHKLHEDRRRLMVDSYRGAVSIFEQDRRITAGIDALEQPIQPVLALFSVVEKIVGLCVEKGILDEEEGAIKEKITVYPIRWIARLIPIFNLLQQSRADMLRNVIELTVNLVASRAPKRVVGEIQDELFKRGWIECARTEQRLGCPEAGSELDQLISSVLSQKKGSGGHCEKGGKEVDDKPVVSASAAAPRAATPKRPRGEPSLRIFAIMNSIRMLGLQKSDSEDEEEEEGPALST